MKTVHKPWGKEVWLELNDFYCYKRLYVNKGTRTSYQYHVEKLETNFIIEGTAEVWLENEAGVVEKNIMHTGEFFTVKPGRKHRIVAITDLILQEVSTPQVDDVVRIEDDSNRVSGRIDSEHLTPAMCILTAGKGSRLGEISNHINKALIPINNKAIISHLIEKTPAEYEIVVAVGYKAQQVVDYCIHMHPERSFKFIEVKNHDPEKTGPATSLYACKDYLQRPFLFSACDILIEDQSIGICDRNWMSVYETAISEIYATVKIEEGSITRIIDKTSSGYPDAWTGMLSIYDYKSFWKHCEESDREIPDILSRTISDINYEPKYIPWYDLGTFDSYTIAKKYFEKDVENYTIPRSDAEIFYKRGGRVCKYFPDGNDKIKKIVSRSSIFSEMDLLPDIHKECSNSEMFCYSWIPGSDLYQIDEIQHYKDVLVKFSNNLWNKSVNISNEERKEAGKTFYKSLSQKRFRDFISQDSSRKNYTERIEINGSIVEDFNLTQDKIFSENSVLYDCIPVLDYHGDFHFANILYNDSAKAYKAIDWRSEFTPTVTWGDVYYDLGKLYAGTRVQFNKIKCMKDTEYTRLINEDSPGKYTLEEHRSESLVEFNSFYDSWLANSEYDVKKVKLIAGLVLCRIASLHDSNQGNFLFLHGRNLINESFKI